MKRHDLAGCAVILAFWFFQAAVIVAVTLAVAHHAWIH